MKPKLIKKIDGHKNEYGWWVRVKYELECAKCGNHWMSGQYGEKISEYCQKCRQEIEYKKQRQRIVNNVIEKISAEIENIKDFEVVNGGLYVRQYDVVQIIDKYAEMVEPQVRRANERRNDTKNNF